MSDNMSIWKERQEVSEERSKDVRDSYERDYSRIIHSSAFRRLQSKTQVLGLGESDFYRTRLTHSMEVAQIGIGILKFLKEKYSKQADGENDRLCILKALPTSSLMGAICLAHDIGHPPFGHGGEIALNICMRDYGGFEGNGQTLRILSKLEKYSKNSGLNPTRRVLLGVLKYPVKYSEVVNESCYGKIEPIKWQSTISEQKPPKCYLDDEEDLVGWILDPLSENEKNNFTSYESKDEYQHKKPLYKSLDTSIMELADDISYGIHDLEDAIALNMIVKDEWMDCFKRHDYIELFNSILKRTESKLIFEDITEWLFSSKSFKRKKAIGTLVNLMITNTAVRKSKMDNAKTDLIKWNAVLKEDCKKILKVINELVHDKVIKDKNVQQLEFKGQKLIVELFEALASNPSKLLPDDTFKLYNSLKSDYSCYELKQKQHRLICDYVSGMTDDYATKVYEKIFLPHKGSVFDRL